MADQNMAKSEEKLPNRGGLDAWRLVEGKILLPGAYSGWSDQELMKNEKTSLADEPRVGSE